MQSKIIEKEVEKKAEYPCLMKSINYGQVVLFVSPNEGFVVGGSEAYDVGTFSSFWELSFFKPFNGTIELSN